MIVVMKQKIAGSTELLDVTGATVEEYGNPSSSGKNILRNQPLGTNLQCARAMQVPTYATLLLNHRRRFD